MNRRISATAERILKNPASEHYILVYDVHNDPRRKRLFRALRGWLKPVQRSVLEGVLTKAELGKVLVTAEEIIDTTKDSVKVFRQAAKIPSVVLGVAKNLVKTQLKPTKPFQNPYAAYAPRSNGATWYLYDSSYRGHHLVGTYTSLAAAKRAAEDAGRGSARHGWKKEVTSDYGGVNLVTAYYGGPGNSYVIQDAPSRLAAPRRNSMSRSNSRRR